MPLTNVAINKAKPMGKTYRLWDSGGMYLEVSPSGGKWWRWKYRYSGKEKRLSFGTFPDIHLHQHHVAGETLDEYRNLGVMASHQQVAFPVTGYRAIFNLGRTFADRDHADELAVVRRFLRVVA